MALNVVLISQRQTASGVALTWGEMEGVASYEVFVASRKLSPEELEACAASNGSADCVFARLPGNVSAMHDDISPAGEARYYGVAMQFEDGTVHAARARAAAAPPPGAFKLSILVPKQAAPQKAAPAVEEDPLEVRKRQQREAREKIAAAAAPKPVTSSVRLSDLQAPPRAVTGSARLSDLQKPPVGDDLDARKRAQQAAREKSAAADPASAGSASNEPPPPPSAVPLETSIDLQMRGATQT
jgi:hypothetical protein